MNAPGGCYEGYKYYNLATHQEYTATAGNSQLATPVACVWTPVLTLLGTLNQSVVFNSSGLPTSSLIADANLTANSAFSGPTAQRVCHAQYNFTNDGGAVGAITPANNCTIPANAVITNVAINSTTAVTSGGAATMSVGSLGTGSSGAAFLALTAKASFSLAAFVQGIPVPQTASTWIKTTTAGAITVTPAVATITAGVVEIYVFYYVSST